MRSRARHRSDTVATAFSIGLISVKTPSTVHKTVSVRVFVTPIPATSQSDATQTWSVLPSLTAGTKSAGISSPLLSLDRVRDSHVHTSSVLADGIPLNAVSSHRQKITRQVNSDNDLCLSKVDSSTVAVHDFESRAELNGILKGSGSFLEPVGRGSNGFAKSTLMLAVTALLLLEKSKASTKLGWSFVASLSAQSIVRISNDAEASAPSPPAKILSWT